MPRGNTRLGNEVTLSLSATCWHILSPSLPFTPSSGFHTLAHFFPVNVKNIWIFLCDWCWSWRTRFDTALADNTPLFESVDRTVYGLLFGKHEKWICRFILPFVGHQPDTTCEGVLFAEILQWFYFSSFQSQKLSVGPFVFLSVMVFQ